MICVTIGRRRHTHLIAEYKRLAEQGAQLVELRLDYVGRTVDLKRLMADRRVPMVITCRRQSDGGRWERSEEERLMLLRSAIASGVEYVDLEEDIAQKIPRYGKTKRIISYHNFEKTPTDLDDLHQRMTTMDADIVKIATTANSFVDTIRMLRLMESASSPTIGICMGEMGMATRILAARYGAPFTYAAFRDDRQIAPGQIVWEVMRDVYRCDSINRSTRLFGVVADPVAHSYSPLLHNAAFANDNLDCRYLPFRIPPDELELFMAWCREEKIGGLSVTIPHKEAMVLLVEQAESAVNGVGALNTVVFRDGESTGYNTDYRAAMDAIFDRLTAQERDDEEILKGRIVLVLGAGGVARAITYGLRLRGAMIAVASRTIERAERLTREINARAVPWDERYDIKPDIIVNCTPVGMHPNLDESPYAKDKLNSTILVFDTVYNPEQTMLIKDARETGCRVITGVEMFVRQAALQYKLFTGLEPNVDQFRTTLKRAISPTNYKNT